MKQSKLELTMAAQIATSWLPQPVSELVFAPPRQWRFDFAWPVERIAVEVEGGTWTEGAHTRGKHFESDAEKYNTATLNGWRVFRFTTDQVNDGRAIDVLKHAFIQLTAPEGR